MDAASPDSVRIPYSPTAGADHQIEQLCGIPAAELLREAQGESLGLAPHEFATVLLEVGQKYNFGFAPGVTATRSQMAAFWRGLQLQDLAIAHACAFGRESAWQQFLVRFRDPVVQAAIGITGSAAAGHELADSLWAELFGLTERGERRRSPLAYYSGRGSLKGFLRTTLAQRNIDRLRRSRRETSLTSDNVADPAADVTAPLSDVLPQLRRCLSDVLKGFVG